MATEVVHQMELFPSKLPAAKDNRMAPKEILEEIASALMSLTHQPNGWTRAHSHCFDLVHLMSESGPLMKECMVHAAVSSALSIHRESILGFVGSEADAFMCLLQSMIDSMSSREPERVVFLDALLNLAIKSSITPRSLDIEGITDRSEYPIFGGGFGDVWRASWQGRRVALKTPRLGMMIGNPERAHKNLCREVLLWRQLHHPHLLEFLGICRELPPYPSIVSPWMENETVVKFVKKHPGVDRLSLLTQIASALSYLHEHDPSVTHQDVRGDNILVNDQHQAVLGDFGISKIDSDCFSSMTSTMSLGCTRWQAPEIMFPAAGAKPTASWASDIWAFGMVALELFTEDLPFAHLATDPAVIIDIYNGRRPDRPTGSELKGPGLSDRVWACVEKCWEKAVSDRPLASDMVKLLKDGIRDDAVWNMPQSWPDEMAESPVFPSRYKYELLSKDNSTQGVLFSAWLSSSVPAASDDTSSGPLYLTLMNTFGETDVPNSAADEFLASHISGNSSLASPEQNVNEVKHGSRSGRGPKNLYLKRLPIKSRDKDVSPSQEYPDTSRKRSRSRSQLDDAVDFKEGADIRWKKHAVPSTPDPSNLNVYDGSQGIPFCDEDKKEPVHAHDAEVRDKDMYASRLSQDVGSLPAQGKRSTRIAAKRVKLTELKAARVPRQKQPRWKMRKIGRDASPILSDPIQRSSVNELVSSLCAESQTVPVPEVGVSELQASRSSSFRAPYTQVEPISQVPTFGTINPYEPLRPVHDVTSEGPLYSVQNPQSIYHHPYPDLQAEVGFDIAEEKCDEDKTSPPPSQPTEHARTDPEQHDEMKHPSTAKSLHRELPPDASYSLAPFQTHLSEAAAGPRASISNESNYLTSHFYDAGFEHYVPKAEAAQPVIVSDAATRLNVTAPSASRQRRRADTKFACPVPGCGSTFLRNFNLQAHLRSHKEEIMRSSPEADYGLAEESCYYDAGDDSTAFTPELGPGCSSQQMQTQAAPLSAQTAESNFSLSRPTASLSAQMQTLVNAQIAGASSENIPHPTSVRRPSQQQLRRGSMPDVQQKYPPVYANGTKILIAACHYDHIVGDNAVNLSLLQKVHRVTISCPNLDDRTKETVELTVYGSAEAVERTRNEFSKLIEFQDKFGAV